MTPLPKYTYFSYPSLLITVCFLISGTFLHSQSIQFQKIPNELGLSQNFISALHQDHLGFLWVGTKDGLNRFDGYEFKVYQNDPFDSTSISGNYIKAIFEDSQQRLWIGTDKGLNLFNREQECFSRLLPLEEAPPISKQIIENYPGLSHRDVSAILEDQQGNIWLGSRQGVVTKMELAPTATDFSQANFTVFSSSNSENSLWGNAIKSLTEDDAGNIWVHSIDNICLISPDPVKHSYHIQRWHWEDINPQWARNQVEDFSYLENGKTVADKRFLNVFAGKDQEVWVKLAGGFARWRPASKDFVFHHLDVNLADYSILPLANSNGKAIIDQAGRIWSVGTAALVIYDTTTHKIIARNHYLRPLEIDMPNDGYQTVLEDQMGNIWIGTSGSGLFKYNPQIKKFSDRDSTKIWTGKSIRSIYETSDGTVWLGTTSLHLLRWDRNTGITTPIILDEQRWKRTHATELDYINCMQEDQQGNLWLGGERGLFSFQLKNGDLVDWSYFKIKSDRYPEQLSSVLDLHLDAAGNIWLLTQHEFGQFDPETGQFDGHDYLGISGGAKNEFNFPCIHQQTNGTFWLGTNEGLLKFLPQTNAFTFFTSDPQNLNSLSHPQVKCIFSDPLAPEKILWIGTGGGGLNRFDLETGQFRHYKKRDGLPDNVIYGILEGYQQDLWLSTNQGLSNFNPRTGAFKNYHAINGLQDNEFNTRAFFKNRHGEIYFGGINGFNLFHPKAIRGNNLTPNIVLTGFKIANQKVDFRNPKTTYQPSAPTTKEITLSWKDKIFSFEFAALDLTAPERNQYAYRMEGFNEDWQYIGNQRSATFTNLSPGTYVFHSKGTNHDGLWNQAGASIKITILPPWFRSWWAYLAYLLTLAGLAYTIYRFQLNRQLDRAEAKRLTELNKVKNQLYTNITHEFRTPLTVIMGMTNNISGHQKQKELIQRNSNKLLRLINQVMDLAKLEAGKLHLDPKQGNIIPYLQYLTESFHSMAIEKKIRLTFYSEVKELFMDFDEEKMGHIAYNLLSNAIKYTEKGGKIIFHAKQESLRGKPHLLLKISDTGIGIPEADQALIFDRFFQVELPYRKNVPANSRGGTGIGLALTKELVELMGGEILVESQVTKGTIFSIFIPIRNEAPLREALSKGTKVIAKKQELVSQRYVSKLHDAIIPKQKKSESTLPLLLLVEDNADVATYICQLLTTDYRVEWAAEGDTGIEMALELIPDLIISDVMMPGKDGFELTEILKTDERTSHIPIILLTAKATEQDKVTGLKTGADAYLMKPFNKEELFVRLEKLLELRIALQQSYSQLEPVLPAYTGASRNNAATQLSMEGRFLQKLGQAVRDHLEDTDFDTTQLAEAVHLSPSQLYRKLKALTGETPNYFIRKIRLHQGLALLQKTDKTISEIAYSVGFNDPNYFSRVFHKEFGESPRSFRK